MTNSTEPAEPTKDTKHASLTTYALRDGIADVVMDDGSVNKMSSDMLSALADACDRAEADEAVLMLRGRSGMFSAGFDLKTFQQGREATLQMMRLGANLAQRLLSFPYPVVCACTGHAYPMGAFLLLSADRRIGTAGDYRIGMNETAIGLTLPLFAVEIARQRLTPPYFQRVTTGDLYGPDEAVAAGFLDEVVPAEQLEARALEVARGLCAIDFAAHAATKQRLRRGALSAIEAAIDAELAA